MELTTVNYAAEAEKVIETLKNQKGKNGKPKPMLTTSQIRNVLAMAMDIYNRIQALSEDALSEEIISQIEYLRVRIIYEAGRDQKVKEFVDTAQLNPILRSINGSRKNYILFTRYMEALVAYHRYLGGKDQ